MSADLQHNAGSNHSAKKFKILSKTIQILCAFAVFGLLIGWSYHLGVRDSSSLPIIEADQGGVRTAPENPGGLQFGGQDREVFRAATNDIKSGMQPQGIAPEPERLISQDYTPQPTKNDAAPIDNQMRRQIILLDNIQPREGVELIKDDELLLKKRSGHVTALPPPPASYADVPVTGALKAIDRSTPLHSDTVSVGGATLSYYNKAPSGTAVVTGAPLTLKTDKTEPVNVAVLKPVTSVPAENMPAKTYAVGIWYVQIAAVGSKDDAQARWKQVQSKAGSLIQAYGLNVEEAAIGAKKFYRAKIGPMKDRSEAVKVCEYLKTKAIDCLVPSKG